MTVEKGRPGEEVSGELERVLIIRPGALGDTLMLLPGLRGLEGGAEVMVAGRGPGLSLLESYARWCMDFEGAGWHRLFEEAGDGDLPVSWYQPQRVVAFLSDDGGVERNLRKVFSGSRVGVFPGRPPKGRWVHAAFYVAECLCRVGLSVDPDHCVKRAREAPLLAGYKGEDGPVVFHPGSGGRNKNHPPEFWQALIREFQGEAGVSLVLGPAEKGLKEEFEGGGKGMVVETWGIEEMVSLLSGAGLYVGHDSGVSHVAAMMGVPTVALFRGTDPVVWGPLGPAVRVIQRDRADEDLVRAVVETARDLKAWRT